MYANKQQPHNLALHTRLIHITIHNITLLKQLPHQVTAFSAALIAKCGQQPYVLIATDT